MPETVVACAVLVADVCDSTRLYEAIGDERAHRLIGECMASLVAQIDTEGGRVIKKLGDGILSTLPTAEASFNAAVGMQKAQANKEISIRVGLNYGPVLERENDVFGDTVNIAAHLTAYAKAGEVFMTEEFVRSLPQPLISRAQFLDRSSFKGRAAPTNIYRAASVGGDAADMTVIGGGVIAVEPQPTSLALRHRKWELTIAQGSREFTVGRDAGCDVVVEGPFVSRVHAAFRIRRGKFYLLDRSANGTFVAYKDSEPVFLKREEIQLHDSGIISLGEDFVHGQENLIYYDCRVRSAG